METPSSILGLGPSPDPLAVQAAYRRLAKQHHPDRGGNPERFRQIRDAYEALCGAAPPAPLTERLAPPRTHWLKVACGLSLGALGVRCWLLGDVAGHYNGWYVALGWGLLLTGWRMLATRKSPLRNPLRDLASGVGHAALIVVGVAAHILALAVGLIALAAGLGVLAKLIG